MTYGPKPDFATNQADRRVADAINGHLEFLRSTWAEPPELAIATAYFNPGGYALLADALDHPSKVRLLLGADPQVPERRVRPLGASPNPARAARAQLNRALAGHSHTLEEDRDLLGFSIEADATGRRLVEWLRSGKVEVRRLEDAFLHGKAFIVDSHNEGVIAGSSNFTYAGLATNIELNLGHYQPHVVEQVTGWFEELWDRAKEFDLAGLYEARYEPHSPQLIYLRMLYERYGAELRAEAEAEGAPRIHLTSFQRDGLWRAKRALAERQGVLIADEVGLGKTFLAGELIREAVELRRQRVLVIAPATLRDGPWRKFLADYMLPVECISFEDLVADERLSPDTGNGAKLNFAPQEYAMVVIDEAHNLRNPSTHRAEALRALLAGLPPKDVVLMTATPVNNSLWDLYYVLGYFLANDAAFADVGIRSLRDHFAEAMAMNPDDLSPEHLFDVLDAVAVRRTRPFVKRYYPNDTVAGPDGRPVLISFPQPRVLKVGYDLDKVLPGFFDRFAHSLDGSAALGPEADPTILTLARYSPSRYRRDGQAESYEVQLAGLLRSGLLKRFESSSHAFAQTCRKMAASHELFLSILAGGHVATGQALVDWPATDADEEGLDDYVELNREQIDPAAEYDTAALRTNVEQDRRLLVAWAQEAETVTREHDPKLACLVEELAAIAAEAEREGIGEQDRRDRSKVLVFSYYADTVDWVHEHLLAIVERDSRLAAYRDRIVSLSGTSGSKQDVLWHFAPRTTDPPQGLDDDLYDIVVTTDVLAEGVNLQQARHIVNYDLPWNPMRLVQRHGRIDRIGSTHSEVFLRCVFPDQQLDDLLGLEESLQRKIQQAAKSVGTGQVLPGSRGEEVVFSETREEIERLRAGDSAIFERGGSGRAALSGEEYRQELREALEDEGLAQRIDTLPWGSGSGMAVDRPGAEPGYVFCARVGDHERPLFRYVGMGGPTPMVVSDTLACLDHARPPQGFETPRVLDEAAHRMAFAAWESARTSIEADWNRAADPANLTPAVPAAMHRAAELVRTHPPPGLTVEDVDTLVDALQAPHPERIVRSIRSAMASSDDPIEQAREVVTYVRDLGLRPSPPPELLPEIVEEDVHLVCWLAITPA